MFLRQDHLKQQLVRNMSAPVSNRGWITLFCTSYHIQPWSGKKMVKNHAIPILFTRWCTQHTLKQLSVSPDDGNGEVSRNVVFTK
jgi:hypothetical protein